MHHDPPSDLVSLILIQISVPKGMQPKFVMFVVFKPDHVQLNTEERKHALIFTASIPVGLQSWTKVLGRTCTFGAFGHTPDANTSALA